MYSNASFKILRVPSSGLEAGMSSLPPGEDKGTEALTLWGCAYAFRDSWGTSIPDRIVCYEKILKGSHNYSSLIKTGKETQVG